MKKSDFKNKLAEEVHAGLKGFINYLLAKADHQPDGSIKIKKVYVDRWRRMSESTHYKLRENEKVWANSITDNIMKVMSSAKKKMSATPPDPRVTEVKEIFVEYCKNIRGFPPEINHAIDGAIIKKMLAKYTVDEMKDLFDWFMNSDRYSKFSCSIKTIMNPGVVNSWLQDRG